MGRLHLSFQLMKSFYLYNDIQFSNINIFNVGSIYVYFSCDFALIFPNLSSLYIYKLLFKASSFFLIKTILTLCLVGVKIERMENVGRKIDCLGKERKWGGRKTREKVFSPGPTIFILPNREENLERKVL